MLSLESVPRDVNYQMTICGIYLEMRTIEFPYKNFSRRYNSFEQFARLQETKHRVHNDRPVQFTSYAHKAFRLFFN